MRAINFTLYPRERFRNDTRRTPTALSLSLFLRSLARSLASLLVPFKGQKGNGRFHLRPPNSSACPGDTRRSLGSSFFVLFSRKGERYLREEVGQKKREKGKRERDREREADIIASSAVLSSRLRMCTTFRGCLILMTNSSSNLQ